LYKIIGKKKSKFEDLHYNTNILPLDYDRTMLILQIWPIVTRKVQS